MNYFSLFGLPVHYQIDVKLVSSIFRDLQRKNHPDKFMGSDQSIQKAAIQKSSFINKAWQTLRDPLTRAEYLLSLNGFNFENKHYLEQDNKFLLEQFELYQELDIIKELKDKKKLENFIQKIKEKFNFYQKNLIEQLNQKNWNTSADIICKLRFFKKLYKKAEHFKDSLCSF